MKIVAKMLAFLSACFVSSFSMAQTQLPAQVAAQIQNAASAAQSGNYASIVSTRDSSGRLKSVTVGSTSISYNYVGTTNQVSAVYINGVLQSTLPSQVSYTKADVQRILSAHGISTQVATTSSGALFLKAPAKIPQDDCPPIESDVATAHGSTVKPDVDGCNGGGSSGGGGVGDTGGTGSTGSGGGGSGSTSSTSVPDNPSSIDIGSSDVADGDLESPAFWDTYFAPDFDVSAFLTNGPQCNAPLQTACLQTCSTTAALLAAGCAALSAAATALSHSAIIGAGVAVLCLGKVAANAEQCISMCQLQTDCD